MIFNPEFHWQIDRKRKSRKTIIICFLILFLFLSIFFIFKKYYFISGRNIILKELVPDNAKVVLSMSVSKIFGNKKDSLSMSDELRSGLQYYLKQSTEKINVFLDNIEKEIYWVEKDNDSQFLLLKIKNLEVIKNFLYSVTEDSKDIRLNGKIIHELSVDWINNPILPLSDNKIYISYLGNHILCVSNDVNLNNDIIDKYKGRLKLSYFRNLKDEFSKYFKEQTAASLKIKHYPDIQNSHSWINNFSFLSKAVKDNEIDAGLNINMNKISLFISSLENIDKFFIENVFRKIPQNYLGDFIIYYSNTGIQYDLDSLQFSENIDNYFHENIESLYNINLQDEIIDIYMPIYFIGYSDKDFVFISKDSEKLTDLYKKMLSHLKPKTRTKILPDKTYAIEYYIDPDSIELKTKQANNMDWYYDDVSGEIMFYLAKYEDWYILSSFKEKIIKLTENKENFYKLLNYSSDIPDNEILILNLKNINASSYLPWISSFSQEYNYLNFANFSKKGDINVFFRLIH